MVRGTNLQDPSQNGPEACDKRLIRLISYIHHTCEYRQYCHMCNTAQAMQTGTVSKLRFCARS